MGPAGVGLSAASLARRHAIRQSSRAMQRNSGNTDFPLWPVLLCWVTPFPRTVLGSGVLCSAMISTAQPKRLCEQMRVASCKGTVVLQVFSFHPGLNWSMSINHHPRNSTRAQASPPMRAGRRKKRFCHLAGGRGKVRKAAARSFPQCREPMCARTIRKIPGSHRRKVPHLICSIMAWE